MKPAHDGDVDPLSLRAVLAGFVVGFVVSAMNVSFGLKAGWAQGGRRVATDRPIDPSRRTKTRRAVRPPFDPTPNLISPSVVSSSL